MRWCDLLIQQRHIDVYHGIGQEDSNEKKFSSFNINFSGGYINSRGLFIISDPKARDGGAGLS
jgi:hypothetical protein